MGWAACDMEKKEATGLSAQEEVKVELSQGRRQMYKLKTRIADIQHQEKRDAMLEQFDMIWKQLDAIEGILYR